MFPLLEKLICLFFSPCLFILIGCGPERTENQGQKMFQRVLPSHSGIEFRNDVDDSGKYTPFNKVDIYAGGGVAVGDIDNDGLEDLLFSSNQNGCRLYRNLGDFHFEDITEKAGIIYEKSWTNGICMVDINSDGRMDIYICRSGLASDTNRANLLFINNGDGTFEEKAEFYGLDDRGTSIHAHFFDLDLDGDLDAYVLNQPPDFEHSFDPLFDVNPAKDSIYSNRFYLNENGIFVEANRQLGVGLEKGFTLSACIGDINNDGWPDVYVANDFISPDYYYINQQGKGFEDQVSGRLDKTTLFSMGSDLADVNNDGHLDLMVTDMEFGDHFRKKNSGTRLSKPYYDLINNRFSYSQYSRNMFFSGSSSGFKEIGQLSGVATTDWSWATLFEDLDNDGLKDLFVTTGIKRDLLSLDYFGLNFDEGQADWPKKRHEMDEMIANMPVHKLPNHTFRNMGRVQFEDVSAAWGLNDTLNGQGAIIADLNNDGALDIVVNNTDTTASIYRNVSVSNGNHIRIDLKYIVPNINGIGSKVEVWTGGQMQLRHQHPNRGYKSSMSTVLHFGIGESNEIDSILVWWPNGELQKEMAIACDQTISIEYLPSSRIPVKENNVKWLQQFEIADHRHKENVFDEIQRERIVPFGLSRSGPALATADLNGDGIPDLVVGSSIGWEIQILFGVGKDEFADSGNHFKETIDRENTALLLFDIDNDGDQDLYVANGSNETEGLTESLRDLVYLNDGKGGFQLDGNRIPEPLLDTRCAVALDVNQDGFEDIFIGGGFVPGVYGRSAGSRILLNKDGRLTDATDELAPELKKLGAIHSAVCTDIDNDGKNELITAGPWEPIRVFEISSDGLSELKKIYPKSGLWNHLTVIDLNADGHPDIIAGNQGLNSFFKANSDEPLELFLSDFDGNGTPDPIVTHYLKHKRGTFVNKSEFCEKMPSFNNRFLTNRQFAESDLSDILTGQNAKDLIHRQVQELETVILINNGKGGFEKIDLPIEVQYAPVKAVCVLNVAGDSLPEILLFGNSNTEFYDQGDITANHGCVLQLGRSGKYGSIPSDVSGIEISGVVNSCVIVNGESIILGRNDDKLMQIGKNEGR